MQSLGRDELQPARVMGQPGDTAPIRLSKAGTMLLSKPLVFGGRLQLLSLSCWGMMKNPWLGCLLFFQMFKILQIPEVLANTADTAQAVAGPL